MLNLDDLFRGLLGDIVRRADCEYTIVPANEQGPFEQTGALVVEKIFIPAVFDQCGNDYYDFAVVVFLREF